MTILKNSFLLLFLIVLCFSCVKEEVINYEIPSIEAFSLTTHPTTTFYFKKDSIPEYIYNEVELPLTAFKEKLNFKIKTKHSERVEIQFPALAETRIIETDTFSIPFCSHFVIKLTSTNKVEKIYAVSLKVAQPLAPVFNALSIDLNTSGNSPLSGKISISCSQSVKASYIVKGQDGADFKVTNVGYDTDTQLNLYGLYAGYTNSIIVRIENQDGLVSSREVFVKTEKLPPDFPQNEEIKINQANQQQVATKFILFFPQRTDKAPPNIGYPVIIDTYGKVRWCLTIPVQSLMKPLQNGRWLLDTKDTFKEVDLLGNVFNTIPMPVRFHHDFTQLPNGDIIYLAEKPDINNTIEDKVCIMEYPSGRLKELINLFDILDPTRTWLPNHTESNDWLHSNSIFYHDVDNSIIISNRHQSTVCKVDLTSKKLKWIISDPTFWKEEFKSYLMKPSGSDFEYSYGQHSALINPFNPNSILIFDNGNFRSYSSPLSPGNSYSRIVEYKINEDDKTIVQNFQFGKEYGSVLYAPYIGSIQCLESDRFLACFGGIVKDASGNPANLVSFEGQLNLNVKNQVRLFEIDRNQNVYLDISLQNFRSYRAYGTSFN